MLVLNLITGFAGLDKCWRTADFPPQPQAKTDPLRVPCPLPSTQASLKMDRLQTNQFEGTTL